MKKHSSTLIIISIIIFSCEFGSNPSQQEPGTPVTDSLFQGTWLIKSQYIYEKYTVTDPSGEKISEIDYDTMEYDASFDEYLSAEIFLISGDTMFMQDRELYDDKVSYDTTYFTISGRKMYRRTYESYDSLWRYDTSEIYMSEDEIVIFWEGAQTDSGESFEYTFEYNLVRYNGEFPPVIWENGVEEDRYENDNLSKYANVITTQDSTPKHSLDLYDNDFYMFAADSGKKYLITVDTKGIYYHFKLILYGTDGDTEIDSSTNYFSSGDPYNIGSDYECALEWECPRTGFYYFEVEAMSYGKYYYDDAEGFYYPEIRVRD